MSLTSVPVNELSLSLDVGVTRAGRKRCPGCQRVRRLIALTVFAADHPVGYGEALCLDCANLRIRPADYRGRDPRP